MSEKLKSCPFLACGGEGEIRKITVYSITYCQVRCKKCGVSGRPKKYLKNAIKWWNQRTEGGKE